MYASCIYTLSCPSERGCSSCKRRGPEISGDDSSRLRGYAGRFLCRFQHTDAVCMHMHGISNGDRPSYKSTESATSQVVPATPPPAKEMLVDSPAPTITSRPPPTPQAAVALPASVNECLLSKSEEEEDFPEDCNTSFCQSGMHCVGHAASILQKSSLFVLSGGGHSCSCNGQQEAQAEKTVVDKKGHYSKPRGCCVCSVRLLLRSKYFGPCIAVHFYMQRYVSFKYACKNFDTMPEELLKNAAKQRIRRMCTPKCKRTDLQVPAWVVEKWNAGTQSKDLMADLLQEVNWDKAGVIADVQCPNWD